MAYNVRNINVLDLRPSTGVGLAIPFDQRAVFKTVYSTKEQTRYNIINFLLTDTGERIFNVQFGAGIRSRLFEQITDESSDQLEIFIRSSIENYFPNIRVANLEIEQDPNRNSLNLQFSYILLTSGDEDEIVLNIQNG